MKDLDMMAWRCGKIYLGQGKYVVEILKRFRMMDYKAMTTPMASNLRLLSVASSESVNATMYHQIICSLMYLMNTRPNIFIVENMLRPGNLWATTARDSPQSTFPTSP